MKRTNDIWAIPPGGFASKPTRGPWLRIAIACSLVLLLGLGGGIVVRSMSASTEVSTADALAQFRDSRGTSSGTGDESVEGRSKTSRKARAKRARRSSGAGSTNAVAAGGSGRVTESEDANAESGERQMSAPSSQRQTTAGVDRGVPKEGVYTWNIDGYEKGPGVTRQLPKRSHRVITHEGEHAWEEHHIYSEQKEQWFHLGGSKEGVFADSVRNRVEMGPVEVDRTVTFDPAMFVSRFPFKVGETWQGRWEGKTSGSYAGRTLDHGTLVIGGEEVEVWVTEVKMQMRGEVEGEVTTRSWVAPDYNMVVKQYQESSVESGPGSYYSEWEGQVRSLQPQT